jgi:tetratricopeptide (TPR) repeat protein
MHHGRFSLVVCLLLALSVRTAWTAAQAPKRPEPPPAAEEPAGESAEEAREKAIAERFRKVLETNPRRGTALDRLYGYHVERGSLDALIGEYATRTKKDPNDGVAWMIIGLLESQRGRDAAAVAAFRRAETALADNAIPPYYLGLSLVLVGQPEAAAEAFERALVRKPNRNDLLDIFQALGRVYQRSQRPEQALAVWSRLEKLYPDDARVEEQIATTLIEEGQLEQALPRLEKLIGQTDDKYRQSTLRMDAAELKVKLKRSADALTDFEKLLGELEPESWLHRDVRRRIEDVFLRNDDLAGLAKYYEKWLGKNATDVDAIARLAKALSTQGRVPEARQWLEKGIAVAPAHRGLRQALVDLYSFEQNYVAAAAQYEAMDKADPNNPDTLREWGKLLLRDSSRPEAERRAAAAAVWKRILEKKPKDPVTASQVADLLRSANATDDAIALYNKAIELAPNAAQYREYLGEYYHSLKRPAEAIAAWRPIADGANRTSKNLARLAEVLAGFGYRKEAVTAMADAVSLEKDDFTLLMTYAELLHQDGRHDEALRQIATAAKLTSNPEEVEQVLAAQIKVYQATEKLGEKIDELHKELSAGKEATAERWLRLARYFEANRQLDRATEVIAKARDKDPKSVQVLTAAARIYESGGDLLAAADANRKLAALDRRFRSEYLTAVAKLEQRLGRREQALQAGRDLLAASPGNPEVYKFFADLCFQLGDQEEGLEALRRSVRANPSDPQGLITLANALSERVRQGEAIELLWRAFEKTNDLDGKLGVIERITALYLENNQFDRLVERLERERREADKAREMTMCMAQAYASAGDLGTARNQLEKLLTENSRDVHLLGQLVALCEQEGDVAAALKYQRQVTAAAPNNHDHMLKLAQLLTRAGEAEEAADIWVKLVAAETEAYRNLESIDHLLTAGKYDTALAILSRLLVQKPGNWELLYRQGAALQNRGKLDEGTATFKALLALRLSDDELGDIAKYQIKQSKKKTTKPTQQGQQNQPVVYNPFQRDDEWALPPLIRRTRNDYQARLFQIRMAVGINPQNYYIGNNAIVPFHAPADFGEARLAALGWMYEAARARGGAEEFVTSLRQAKDRAGADPRALWDWYYFQTLRGENKDLAATARTLSRGNDPEGLLAYLTVLPSRDGQFRYRRLGAEVKDKTPPLPSDQLDHVLACYRRLKAVNPEWVSATITQTVMTEVKRSKREDQEKALYQDLLTRSHTPSQVHEAMRVAIERNDLEAALELFARLDRLQGPPKNAAQLAQLPTRLVLGEMEVLMAKRADDKKWADVLHLLDVGLAVDRRHNLAAPRTVSASRRWQGNGMNLWVYGLRGAGRSVSLNFPSPNDYYDIHNTSYVYAAFALYKEADLMSDLYAHMRKQVGAATGPDKLYLHLALGYLYWWAGDKDEALEQLGLAVKSAPGDHNLVLEVAAMREHNGEPEAALALLDSVTPLDTPMLVRREEAALRLAERTGALDRARQAADRLFGLRMDADKQIELASQMHRLGLSTLAETVLNRAQRQAGNKTATLLRLMTQYQSQNQTDLAVQIARQILRKAPSTPGVNNPYNRGGNEVDNARSQAIGVLARSGKIKEMIERAEAQLKASPKSVQIYQTLAAYYQAAGDKEKLKGALLKTADLKPDDGRLRFQVAQQLEQAGERDAAMAQYKIAIKLEPSVFGNSYWQIQNLFMQANKLDELGQVLDEVNVSKLGYFWSVTQPVMALLQNEPTREIGLKLFKKAWNAFPQQQRYILGNLYDPSIWRLPEMYDYAKQATIPRADTEADPWQAASEVINYGGEGRVDGVVTRLLAVARRQQRLPELRGEVAAALARRPDWTCGKALLAAIDIQLGKKEQGMKEWQEAFAEGGAPIPPLARFILTQELEFYGGVEGLAVKTLEAGLEELMSDDNVRFQSGFSMSPARRLVWWYQLLGRKDDAHKLMLRFARGDTNPGYGGGYWEFQKLQNRMAVAQELLRTGDAIEAVRIYNELLADREALEQAAQWGGGGQSFEQQAEEGMRTALKAIKPSTLPQVLHALLIPREGPGTHRLVLDLALLIESRDLSKATLSSVFATAVRATAKAPAARKEALAKLADLEKKYPADLSVVTASALTALAGEDAVAARSAVERLVKLVESMPLEPLPPHARANSRQRGEAMPQVIVWLVAQECLARGRDEFRAAGEKLAARASAAAKRQQDPLYAAGILRTWGQMDLERGDKTSAEGRWAEILELLLPRPTPAKAAAVPVPAPPVAAPAAVPAAPSASRPQARSTSEGGALPLAGASALLPRQERSTRGTALLSRPDGSGEPSHVSNLPDGGIYGPAAWLALAQVPPPPAAAAPKAAAPRANIPVVSSEQFQQTYQVALLAAEKGAPALSMRAMKDALRGGPPAPPTNRGGGGPFMSRMINGVWYYQQMNSKPQVAVDQALVTLVGKWRTAGVPAAEIYEVLAAVVLPEARPAEVFTHGDGSSSSGLFLLQNGMLTPAPDVDGSGPAEDRGLAALLADVALEAGKAGNLRARVEARAAQPLGELPAKVLLATLALRAGDDARLLEIFKGLDERIRKDAQANTNDRVATILLPAFADPRYAARLARTVEKAAENYAAGGNTARAAELRFKLADYHLGRKDEAAARAQFKVIEGFAKKVGPNQYSPHLPLAQHYLKVGWTVDALKELGLHADGITAASADPRARGRQPEPTLSGPEFPLLVRRLLELPAVQRYDALKDWSLPTAGRKSIRYYVGALPVHLPPPELVKLPPLAADQVVSTLALLADAAREAGKLDRLVAEADRLAADKVENADLLRVFCYLARGKGKEAEPIIKAYADEARKRLTEPPPAPPQGPRYFAVNNEVYQEAPVYPSEFLVATRCLADPALAAHGLGLLGPMQFRALQTQNVEYLARIRAARDHFGAARAGAPHALEGAAPPRWHADNERHPWFAQEGYLTYGGSPANGFLLFDTPLGGTFELAVDAYQGHGSQSHVGYGGVVFEPNQDGGSSVIWPVSHNEQVMRRAEGCRGDSFNRLTVQVTPTKVRCLVNGVMFYEDTDAPPTSPWLMLVAGPGRRPVFRNFRLTGKPEVLPEVKLTAGDYLDGWAAQPYPGVMPQRLTPKESDKPQQQYDQWGMPAQPREPVYDWQAKSGEIQGRKLERPTERPVPSRLAYFRPLRPGETLRYEFFYEPGKTHVHPSLGRLAFLLEPVGVRLHWLIDAVVDDWTGLAADNAITLPSQEGGKGPLPLKAGAWNALAVRTTADEVTLELNGANICALKLPVGLDREFGLFHYRERTAVRVRHAVLSGPWPRAVGSPEEMGFQTKPPSPEAARARRWQLGERYYFTEAGDVVARARQLPAAQRYELLARWVLPVETRPTFQLAGRLQPLDVLGVVDQQAQPGGRRVLQGGRLEAPCLELVAAAREAGKLDELADRVARAELPAADERFGRSRAALLAAVRAAQGRDEEAAAILKTLVPQAEKMRLFADAAERWPDLIAVTAALERPALLGPATALAQAANKNIEQAIIYHIPFEDRDWWLRAWRVARGRALVLAQPPQIRRPYGSDGNFAHWASLPAVDAMSRSHGWAAPHWSYHEGAVVHFPGHSDDFLMFRTPLRGDFEVTCGLRLQDWREAQVRYGSYQLDLGHEWKKYRLHTTLRHNGPETTITPPLPGKGTTYQLRLAVKGGWLRVYVDGREVAAERIGTEPEPWLMLHCNHLDTGDVRDLKIAGKPVVPMVIDLLAGEDLPLWRPYLGFVSEGDTRRMGVVIGGNTVTNGWMKRGEEMFEAGARPEPPEEGKPIPPRYFPESAIFYQRPFLEDGAIEYEFYYDPDKSHMSPALDRLVFLLEPDGVKLHWLTDGPNDKSGVKFDNVRDEPPCRRGPSQLPLKPRAWNRVRLAVAGDSVKIALNGVEVYERPIEPTNGRFFGLFHYTDRTEARVRGLRLSGDWPRQLPPKDKLFERRQ